MGDVLSVLFFPVMLFGIPVLLGSGSLFLLLSPLRIVREWKHYRTWFKFNLIVLALVVMSEEIHLYYFDGGMFTSSGDITIRLSAFSLAAGYTLLGALFVYAALIAWRRVRKPSWHFPVLLAGLLFVEYNNTHCLVCGTNGSRWYDYHYRSFAWLGGYEYLGTTDEEFLHYADQWRQRRGEYISSVGVNGSELVVHRPHGSNYRFRHSFLIWNFDEKKLKPLLLW